VDEEVGDSGRPRRQPDEPDPELVSFYELVFGRIYRTDDLERIMASFEDVIAAVSIVLSKSSSASPGVQAASYSAAKKRFLAPYVEAGRTQSDAAYDDWSVQIHAHVRQTPDP
jgi:hypothetical protein